MKFIFHFTFNFHTLARFTLKMLPRFFANFLESESLKKHKKRYFIQIYERKDNTLLSRTVSLTTAPKMILFGDVLALTECFLGKIHPDSRPIRKSPPTWHHRTTWLISEAIRLRNTINPHRLNYYLPIWIGFSANEEFPVLFKLNISFEEGNLGYFLMNSLLW